jgi:hypothetical protein
VRLHRTWATVEAAQLHPETKSQLMNIAWSLASFERAYNVLDEDARRAEQARAVGVPAIMAMATGPYKESLEYLLTTSLWMDLGDILAAYRTIMDRLGNLKRSIRRHPGPLTQVELDRQSALLEARRLPSLSDEPLRNLAVRILHIAWHPTADDDLAIYWKGTAEQPVIDFAPGDVRDELLSVVEDTSRQINEFLSAVAG